MIAAHADPCSLLVELDKQQASMYRQRQRDTSEEPLALLAQSLLARA
jgi:hypothetical protein